MNENLKWDSTPSLHLLAEVCRWFIEGCDTAGLQEAKAWLEDRI